MKIKSNILLAAVFLLLLGFVSCSKPQIKNACENVSIDDFVDSTDVLIASAFSPNGDGINDNFRPRFFSKKIKEIDMLGNPVYVFYPDVTISFFQVKKWNTGKVVYDGFLNNYEGWDGSFDGETCRGYYKYNITVDFSSGESKSYEGEICIIEGDECYKNMGNCVWEDQLITGQQSTIEPIANSSACQ